MSEAVARALLEEVLTVPKNDPARRESIFPQSNQLDTAEGGSGNFNGTTARRSDAVRRLQLFLQTFVDDNKRQKQKQPPTTTTTTTSTTSATASTVGSSSSANLLPSPTNESISSQVVPPSMDDGPEFVIRERRASRWMHLRFQANTEKVLSTLNDAEKKARCDESKEELYTIEGFRKWSGEWNKNFGLVERKRYEKICEQVTSSSSSSSPSSTAAVESNNTKKDSSSSIEGKGEPRHRKFVPQSQEQPQSPPRIPLVKPDPDVAALVGVPTFAQLRSMGRNTTGSSSISISSSSRSNPPQQFQVTTQRDVSGVSSTNSGSGGHAVVGSLSSSCSPSSTLPSPSSLLSSRYTSGVRDLMAQQVSALTRYTIIPISDVDSPDFDIFTFEKELKALYVEHFTQFPALCDPSNHSSNASPSSTLTPAPPPPKSEREHRASFLEDSIQSPPPATLSKPPVPARRRSTSNDGSVGAQRCVTYPPPRHGLAANCNQAVVRHLHLEFEPQPIHQLRSCHVGVLFSVALNIFLRYPAIHRLPIDLKKLIHLIRIVEDEYRDNSNPYHNSIHAADVLHTCHLFLQPIKTALTGLEIFSTLFAALIHDIGHLGVNNDFMTASRHPLSLMYNDRSPMENMHCAFGFVLMETFPELLNPFLLEETSEPHYTGQDNQNKEGGDHGKEDGDEEQDEDDAFRVLNRQQMAGSFSIGAFTTGRPMPAIYTEFRKIVTNLVIATDMAHHGTLVNRITTSRSVCLDAPVVLKGSQGTAVGELDIGEMVDAAAPGFSSVERVDILLSLLHLADVSNPLKPLPIYREWANRVVAEFWVQGDEEKRLGRKRSFNCERDPASRQSWAKGQTGFVKMVVQPFSELNAPIVPKRFRESVKENAAFLTTGYIESAKAEGLDDPSLYQIAEIERLAKMPWTDPYPSCTFPNLMLRWMLTANTVFGSPNKGIVAFLSPLVVGANGNVSTDGTATQGTTSETRQGSKSPTYDSLPNMLENSDTDEGSPHLSSSQMKQKDSTGGDTLESFDVPVPPAIQPNNTRTNNNNQQEFILPDQTPDRTALTSSSTLKSKHHQQQQPLNLIPNSNSNTSSSSLPSIDRRSQEATATTTSSNSDVSSPRLPKITNTLPSRPSNLTNSSFSSPRGGGGGDSRVGNSVITSISVTAGGTSSARPLDVGSSFSAEKVKPTVEPQSAKTLLTVTSNGNLTSGSNGVYAPPRSYHQATTTTSGPKAPQQQQFNRGNSNAISSSSSSGSGKPLLVATSILPPQHHHPQQQIAESPRSITEPPPPPPQQQELLCVQQTRTRRTSSNASSSQGTTSNPDTNPLTNPPLNGHSDNTTTTVRSSVGGSSSDAAAAGVSSTSGASKSKSHKQQQQQQQRKDQQLTTNSMEQQPAGSSAPFLSVSSISPRTNSISSSATREDLPIVGLVEKKVSTKRKSDRKARSGGGTSEV